MKITALEMANVKRVKALRLEPNENGLTTIGGRNGQGKTSVLDAIAYGLGGEKFRPSKLKREGAVGDSFIHIETDDGLIIDRKGKNASLTVTDSTGRKAGQSLLDAIVGKLAIDLPKFINSSNAEKAKTLLGILGIGDKLAQMEREEKAKFDSRTAVGRLRDTKRKAAEDMPWYEDAPDKPVLISDLVKQQQDILARNGIRAERMRKLNTNRQKLDILKKNLMDLEEAIKRTKTDIEAITREINESDHIDEMESTDEIKAKIAEFEETNNKVRINAERADKIAEAAALGDEYNALTLEIEKIRAERIALLNGADLPLPELSIEDGELVYKGAKWDCMSGAQQLIVACAIVSKLNPDCKFVLIDKLEQLDCETLMEFDAWLKEQGLQCIATRVSTDGSCTIEIDDGEVVGEKTTINFAKKTADDFGDY